MKRVLLSIVILVALVAWAGGRFAEAALTGSAHDFSTYGWAPADGAGAKCGVCHAPHGALVSVPLWNHAATSSTFTLYPAGGTLNSAPGQPTGVSLLCLSCHDNSINVDAFGGGAGTVKIDTIDAAFDLGTDLSNDHPIAIQYNAALVTADGQLEDTATVILAGLPLFGGSNDQLECATCHDVHNNGASAVALLRLDNDTSQLCLTCHTK